MKQFKLHSINSNGGEIDPDSRIEFQVIDPNTRKPFKDEDGNPSVVIMLKPISPKKYRKVVSDHTERIPARKGQPPSEDTDWDAVQDSLVVYCVESWKGLIGADDKPLECVSDVKIALPGDLKNDIVERALKGEAVEVAAASFRQSA